MHFGIYSYLVTTIIFAAGAAVIEWTLSFRILFPQRRLIGIMVLVGLLAALFWEPIALRWGVWTFNPERSFNMLLFGVELETYLYAILAALAVASATVVWARWEERGMPLIKTTWITLIGKIAKRQGTGRQDVPATLRSLGRR